MPTATAPHKTPKLPATIRPESITAIIDTREQLPLDLQPLGCEPGTLTTGDYAIKGLEHVATVERKSLGDLLGCCGQSRERFERELQRMRAYPVRCVVVESTWAELLQGEWRSKLTPEAVTSSVTGWMALGIPFALVGSHEQAGRFVAKLLYITARREWRKLRALAASA